MGLYTISLLLLRIWTKHSRATRLAPLSPDTPNRSHFIYEKPSGKRPAALFVPGGLNVDTLHWYSTDSQTVLPLTTYVTGGQKRMVSWWSL